MNQLFDQHSSRRVRTRQVRSASFFMVFLFRSEPINYIVFRARQLKYLIIQYIIYNIPYYNYIYIYVYICICIYIYVYI